MRNLWPYTQSADFTFGDSLFGAIKLNKTADPDKFKYYSYGIGFDARGSFSLSNGIVFGKNVTYLVLI